MAPRTALAEDSPTQSGTSRDTRLSPGYKALASEIGTTQFRSSRSLAPAPMQDLPRVLYVSKATGMTRPPSAPRPSNSGTIPIQRDVNDWVQTAPHLRRYNPSTWYRICLPRAPIRFREWRTIDAETVPAPLLWNRHRSLNPYEARGRTWSIGHGLERSVGDGSYKEAVLYDYVLPDLSLSGRKWWSQSKKEMYRGARAGSV